MSVNESMISENRIKIFFSIGVMKMITWSWNYNDYFYKWLLIPTSSKSDWWNQEGYSETCCRVSSKSSRHIKGWTRKTSYFILGGVLNRSRGFEYQWVNCPGKWPLQEIFFSFWEFEPMERHELKRVTEGALKNKSLIFHLVDSDRNNYEYVIANTNLKSLNLRLV